jgi:hypothetical protein
MAVVLLTRAASHTSPQQDSAGAAPRPGLWWRDLLNYEHACFLLLATRADGPPTNRPRRGLSALCMNFAWQIPAVIQRLEENVAVTEELRRPLTLLFARRPDGHPCVVEVGPNVEKVFRATNGLRTAEQIAATAGVSLEETTTNLQALAAIGAVVHGMSPAEMMRLINSGAQR